MERGNEEKPKIKRKRVTRVRYGRSCPFCKKVLAGRSSVLRHMETCRRKPDAANRI